MRFGYSQTQENFYNEIEILGAVFDVYNEKPVFYVNNEEVSVTSYGYLHRQIGEKPIEYDKDLISQDYFRIDVRVVKDVRWCGLLFHS